MAARNRFSRLEFYWGLFLFSAIVGCWFVGRALSRKNSQPLLLTPETYVCAAHQNEMISAPIEIKNVTKETVRVVGARSCCGCTVAHGLPLDLAPGCCGKIILTTKVGAPESQGKHFGHVQLLINQDGFVPLLTVEAKVIRQSSDL